MTLIQLAHKKFYKNNKDSAVIKKIKTRISGSIVYCTYSQSIEGLKRSDISYFTKVANAKKLENRIRGFGPSATKMTVLVCKKVLNSQKIYGKCFEDYL